MLLSICIDAIGPNPVKLNWMSLIVEMIALETSVGLQTFLSLLFCETGDIYGYRPGSSKGHIWKKNYIISTIRERVKTTHR